MLTTIPNKTNESLILELSEEKDAGTIGGYCEDGFPIYYANNKIAYMLGYEDVDDLIAGIHGKVANTIHPDDMERVVKELNNGEFYEGMTYNVTYRMPKKDGTSLWTVDKGKVIRAEDGRLAILSICKDMTEFIDRHAELERLNWFSQSTLENMPGGYHRCAAEEGYPFLYISDRFCEMFGWTREEIKTKFDNKFINMLHPEDTDTTEQYVEMLKQSSNENVIDAIYRMKGKNGYIWVSDSTSRVTVGNETFYQGTLTDITSFVVKCRKQDESHKEQLAIINALSQSFRNVFVANLSEGTARAIRLDDNYNVRAIRDVNGQTFQFDAVVDRWVRETVHPDDKKRIKETLNVKNIRQIFASQDKCVGTYRNIEDGVEHHYQYDFRRVGDTDNVVAGFQLIDKIVEEQKENQKREKVLEEERLKGEKEHAEVINSLSTIYSTIFQADIITHEYEILTSVPLMGMVVASKGTFDDVEDTIIETFMESEFREPLREFLDLNTLADRLEKVNTVTTDYKAPTGQWMQARFIVKRRDKNGRAVETLYVVRDITEESTRDLKQKEFLTQTLEAAQQANKAKTTFLNNMSHDIRTPMNAIIGFTTLAQMHLDDPAQVKDCLRKISTSSNHLLSLINSILDMSRIESGRVKLDEKAVHIPDLLHDLRTMIQSLVNSKNLNLFVDAQDVVHEDVLTDKLRLNQVLLNIVGNAIKFTQSGGDIMIRLMEKPCSLKHYATYEFSVKDNGIGMTKEFIGHIFDAFSREYSSTVSGIQGTGLGMTITKNIVDMMGGDIQVESEEGKGSLFRVTLNFRLVDEPVKEEEKTKCYDYSGKRVLLVEDNELNREIAATILEETGMTVDSVEDGDIAVATIDKEPADKYDLILMDIQMPRMDGYTATREIRTLADNKKANIPIVAVTANVFEEDRKKVIESGMNGHIIKPISIEEIARVLDQIL